MDTMLGVAAIFVSIALLVWSISYAASIVALATLYREGVAICYAAVATNGLLALTQLPHGIQRVMSEAMVAAILPNIEEIVATGSVMEAIAVVLPHVQTAVARAQEAAAEAEAERRQFLQQLHAPVDPLFEPPPLAENEIQAQVVAGLNAGAAFDAAVPAPPPVD